MSEAVAPPGGRHRRLMGCTHSSIDPASRFRFLQFVPYLQEAGWRISHRPNFPSRYWQPAEGPPAWRTLQKKWAKRIGHYSRWRDILDAARHDIIFINRDLLDGQLRWEQRMMQHNHRVIFDFDDAIFLGEERKSHIEWICRHAAWVTAGNETLASFARTVTDRVTVLPSVVDTDRHAPSRHEDHAPLRVGWLGSDLSIRETLFPHVEMFARLQRQLGFEFVVISKPRRELPAGAGLRWRFVEWSPSVEENIAQHIDIGVMPLLDNEYQRGKCGMKILQYMAGAIPAIASPVGINCDLIQDGHTGFLAGSEAEWSRALEALIASTSLRKALGTHGKNFCEENYSLKAWLPKLLKILDRVASSPPLPRAA